MRRPRIIAIVVSLLGLTACTTPVMQSESLNQVADKDSSFDVQKREDGFALDFYYSRYQFFPETAALVSTCKSNAMAVAWDVAEKQGKKLKPINEQRIKVSFGRNGFTGMTSCNASLIAEWDR